MKNIKFAFVLLFVIISNLTNAQQIKNYNLYNQNPVLYNPATVLNEDFLSIYLNSHLQWIGYTGAPRVNEFGLGVSFFPNMGAGISVISNKIGLYNNVQVNLKYAYSIIFSSQHYLNMGMSLGISNSALLVDDAVNVDISDITLIDNASKLTSVTSGFGLYYRYNNFDAQFMMPQLFDQKLLNLYSIGVVGYKFNLSQTFDFKPSVLARTSTATPFQVNLNAMAIWKDMLWSQVSFSSEKSVVVSIGMDISNYSVGYAYQAESKPLSVCNNGTHEIQLIYHFGKGLPELQSKKTNVYGKILNEYDNSPVVANVKVYDGDKMINEIQTNDDGFYSVELTHGKNYRFEIQSADYQDKNELVTIEKDTDEKDQSFNMKPLKTYVYGNVLNQYSKNGVNADIMILEGNKVIAETKTDSDGAYAVYLEPEKEYTFRISADNFDKNIEKLVIAQDSKISKDFELNPIVNFSIVVSDSETGTPVGINVDIYDNTNDKSLGTVSTDPSTGKYTVELKDVGEVKLHIESYDFYPYDEVVDIDYTDNNFVKEVKLQTLTLEQKVVLTNVFFDFDKYELRQDALPDINRLIFILKQNPDVTVEISGYTDNTGTAAYNKRLSKKRAQSVVDYMIDNGIEKNRLKVVGYGLENPKVNNDTEENRQLNRRVEAKIVLYE